MNVYYNEHDPYAAQWLRNLIAAGLIPAGVVDERDIRDVRPSDLKGYAQCHFFAGIGGWPYALRLAGWPDDEPVWTGSCPCQPFSAAGRRNGFADERHLWPHWHWLISQCRPGVVFGEQVASKDGLAWLDLVQADMEGAGYAVGAADLCAAGVGAPHIRQRLFFVAESEEGGRRPWWAGAESARGALSEPARSGAARELADAARGRRREERADAGRSIIGNRAQWWPAGCVSSGAISELAHSNGGHAEVGHLQRSGQHGQQPQDGVPVRPGYQGIGHFDLPELDRPRPTNGFWRDADWLFCRDGKWRPTQPSPQPLADGSAESLGRVCPETVAEVEEEVNAAAMEAEIEPAALLRNVWNALAAEAPRLWTAGRLPGLHEAPFLLAFLRQLAEQGWRVAQRIPVPSAEVDRERVRMLRTDDRASRSPHKYGLEGQPAGKHSDVVRVLSSVLARHAHSAWGDAYQAYAETCSPLASGAPARVGRLRAYGNAIVPAVAAEFIKAYRDAR